MMDAPPPAITLGERQDHLLHIVASLLPAMRSRAAALDAGAVFPHADVAALRDAGALLAPFPHADGGLCMGSEPEGGAALARLLRLLGRGNLAVGRLYEAHVNAVRLIARYGTADLRRRAAANAGAGRLFALWVTDPVQDALAATAQATLRGGKVFCSGAGAVERAVVTVQDDAGHARLAYLHTDAATSAPLPGGLQGMRAATTGRVAFDGLPILPGDWIGAPGDYLREPDFSAGAWRTSAVTCGGLEELVALAMQQLVARGRAGDPHQQARMGRAWIAQETALGWLSRAAAAAEGEAAPDDPAAAIATVNFARIAIEAACLEAITLVERSIGLGAFQQSNPIERLRRDLGTYLRQPAGDEVLTQAAAFVMQRL